MSQEDAVFYLRSELLSRADNVQIVLDENTTEDTVGDILELALLETSAVNSSCGDYLRWSMKSWGYSYSRGLYDTTIDYVFTYYTTAQQEIEIDNACAVILQDMKFTGDDYSDVKQIYDYMCHNIHYAYFSDDMAHTAYDAIIKHCAVCQGYSVLFYKLLYEAGIPSRIIAGDGHCWNIVCVDGMWYNTDVTWDSALASVNRPYKYFLKADVNFEGHIVEGDVYPTNRISFNDVKSYLTMAEQDYDGSVIMADSYMDNITIGEKSQIIVNDNFDKFVTMVDTIVIKAMDLTVFDALFPLGLMSVMFSIIFLKRYCVVNKRYR